MKRSAITFHPWSISWGQIWVPLTVTSAQWAEWLRIEERKDGPSQKMAKPKGINIQNQMSTSASSKMKLPSPSPIAPPRAQCMTHCSGVQGWLRCASKAEIPPAYFCVQREAKQGLHPPLSPPLHPSVFLSPPFILPHPIVPTLRSAFLVSLPRLPSSSSVSISLPVHQPPAPSLQW